MSTSTTCHPSKDGVLSLGGEFKNEAAIQTEEDFRVQIYFDQSPRPLTRGQLARTYCYDIGQPIAGLRPPVKSGWSYPERTSNDPSQSRRVCPDPYEIDPNSLPLQHQTPKLSHYGDRPVIKGRKSIDREFTYPWITAEKWEVQPDQFVVSTDVSQLISTHGDGVYTIMLWANLRGEIIPVSQYSIFIPALP